MPVTGTSDLSVQRDHPNRVRSFPHVEGNYALHVYIPGNLTFFQLTILLFISVSYERLEYFWWVLVSIPLTPRKELSLFLKRVAAVVRELHVVDVDIPLSNLIKDEQKFDQVVLGREFHVSLGRTVPIRVHQRDSMVAMLRQRLQSHRR